MWERNVRGYAFLMCGVMRSYRTGICGLEMLGYALLRAGIVLLGSCIGGIGSRAACGVVVKVAFDQTCCYGSLQWVGGW